MQDADKQRPYYGRALGAWEHIPRKSTRILPGGRGIELGRGASAHPSTQAGRFTPVLREKTCKQHQPPSIVGTLLARVLRACPRPVPSRTRRAWFLRACPRPVPSRTRRAWLLPAWVRPACLPAPCALTHPTCLVPACLPASCAITHPTCLVPACLPASCAITHPTCLAPACLGASCAITTPTCLAPACLCASCAITHPTCLVPACLGAPCNVPASCVHVCVLHFCALFAHDHVDQLAGDVDDFLDGGIADEGGDAGVGQDQRADLALAGA